jgi:PAS domain S-box-containing protein
MTAQDFPMHMDIYNELELHQFEKLNEALFLHHPDAIYLLDLEGNFLMVNEEVCRVTGYPRESLIGQNFAPFIEDSMKAFTQEKFLLSKQDKPQRYETTISTRTGVIYIDVTNFPLKSDNKILAIFGIAKDITEKKRKAIELEQYTTILKLHNEELEIFRKILAHDLRKPVANALGFSRLLQATLPADKEKEIKRYLLQTVEAADTMVRDLNELIALQSTGLEIKEEVEVRKCINRILAFFQDDIKHAKATVRLEIDETLQINTIKAYFNSILRNLISNAIKYRQPDRELVVAVTAGIEKDKLVITVQDNGIGMDLVAIGKDLFKMHRRFAPKAAEGNGLGLYIVKQQVSLMGGNIEVNSKIGAGTTFKLTIPVA